MRPSDVPDVRRRRRRRHRDHRQGCADGAGPATTRRVYELARPRLRALHDGRGDRRRAPTAGGRGAAPARRDPVATKYPRDRRGALRATPAGQVEIVEVKGSVELAPLTGLVEAIVDLTATGTTLRENNLVDSRGVRCLHGAADRQPGRPQAEGGGDRRAAGAQPCRLSVASLRRPGRWSPRSALARCPQAPSVAGGRGRDHRRAYARRGRRRRGGTRRASTPTPPPPVQAGPAPMSWRRALGRARPAVRAGLEVALANVAEVRLVGADEDRELCWRRASASLLREVAGRARRRLRARAAGRHIRAPS